MSPEEVIGNGIPPELQRKQAEPQGGAFAAPQPLSDEINEALQLAMGLNTSR